MFLGASFVENLFKKGQIVSFISSFSCSSPLSVTTRMPTNQWSSTKIQRACPIMLHANYGQHQGFKNRYGSKIGFQWFHQKPWKSLKLVENQSKFEFQILEENVKNRLKSSVNRSKSLVNWSKSSISPPKFWYLRVAVGLDLPTMVVARAQQ
jgi:hypothetical protein